MRILLAPAIYNPSRSKKLTNSTIKPLLLPSQSPFFPVRLHVYSPIDTKCESVAMNPIL